MAVVILILLIMTEKVKVVVCVGGYLLPILFLSLVVIAVIELSLFIVIGGAIGVGLTLALIILSSVLGIALVRQRGMQTLMATQSSLIQEGSSQSLLENMLFVIAGILLIVPGFMTDAIGALLLVAPLRIVVAKRLANIVLARGGFQFGSSNGSFYQSFSQNQRDGYTFDGEYERKDQQD